jgi:pyrimidine operon attenuation protein/uracil phosphoribosyltransferase
MSNEIKILSRKQISQKILRLSWEIYENNFDEKELVIVGVGEKGFLLAEELSNNLSKISAISPLLTRLDINSNKSSDKSTVLSEKNYKNKVIILVDDVLYSGKTLMYACKNFLNTSVKKMSVLVLIDRNHNSYPIKADYVGVSLSTTLKEYIKVILLGKNQGVYLS